MHLFLESTVERSQEPCGGNYEIGCSSATGVILFPVGEDTPLYKALKLDEVVERYAVLQGCKGIRMSVSAARVR